MDDNGWRSIKTAPRDGTRILAYSPRGKGVSGAYFAVTWWRNDAAKYGYIGWGEFNQYAWPPTHWQPLPAPPEADK